MEIKSDLPDISGTLLRPGLVDGRPLGEDRRVSSASPGTLTVSNVALGTHAPAVRPAAEG
ncbi:hypothetical protein [Amycolatopsis decaplanina]|uniref:hypothetical protein n=1 Tax=Amycolatopsis decaplanina TaxID=208441 RepID=UPI00034817AC|nr:hypothetical protein [Amycolatopsis decaplanina]